MGTQNKLFETSTPGPPVQLLGRFSLRPGTIMWLLAVAYGLIQRTTMGWDQLQQCLFFPKKNTTKTSTWNLNIIYIILYTPFETEHYYCIFQNFIFFLGGGWGVVREILVFGSVL